MTAGNVSTAKGLSTGVCAALACIYEVSAHKPGNVHRGADFEDLSYVDFVASAAAIQVGIIHNFIWNDHWTFKDRREQSGWLTRFRNYELTAFACMLINWTVLAVLVGWAHQPLLTSNLIGIASGAVLNFVVSKLWTWKRQPAPVQ
jgi:putative flippase GtrA